MMDIIEKIFDARQHTPKKGRSGIVCYFPVFNNEEELTSHYYRACWYMPRVSSLLEEVCLPAEKGMQPGDKPAYFGSSRQPVEHIRVLYQESEIIGKLAQADMILLWRTLPTRLRRRLEEACPNTVFLDVNTHDIEAIEYGNYCKIHWRLMTPEQRAEYLELSRLKFQKIADNIFKCRYRASAVFGTGPSIEKAFDYDFRDCFSVVCNSIVQNDDLINHIDPDFICAGDVVSHLGVSLYAEKFREDLFRQLQHPRRYFFTTAQFGLILLLQYPELREKIILCDQTSREPVYDLLKTWALPQLDSTMNIHMMPLAATFSDTIYVLGNDGKNPNPKKNEDFWAHSAKAQYHDLVITGHQAHPTFDKRRQVSTYERHLKSVEVTISQGLQKGKRYYSLEPSFIPAFHEVEAPQEVRERMRRRFGVARRKRILVTMFCNPNVFSGGRYSAFMAVEALLARGHHVTVWTNASPMFLDDLAKMPAHDQLHLHIADFETPPDGAFDVVMIIPDMSNNEAMYRNALDIAARYKARTVLYNFETPNWFNALAPQPRDPMKWELWLRSSRYCDAILSITRESSFHARDFYLNGPEHMLFRHAYPAINSPMADKVRARKLKRKKQIVIISRFGAAAVHKGMDLVTRMNVPEMQGHKIIIIAGTGGKASPKVEKSMRDDLARYGIDLEIVYNISDEEKFTIIAQSKCMIFPSSFEGFGYPPVEAEYMSTPVIAYDLPVLREVSCDNIIYVPLNDVEAMRRALSDLLRNYPKGKYLEKIHGYIRNKVSIEKYSESLQQLLDDLEQLRQPSAASLFRKEDFTPVLVDTSRYVERLKTIESATNGKDKRKIGDLGQKSGKASVAGNMASKLATKSTARHFWQGRMGQALKSAIIKLEVATVSKAFLFPMAIFAELASHPEMRKAIARGVSRKVEILPHIIQQSLNHPDGMRLLSKAMMAHPRQAGEFLALLLDDDNVRRELGKQLRHDTRFAETQVYAWLRSKETARIVYTLIAKTDRALLHAMLRWWRNPQLHPNLRSVLEHVLEIPERMLPLWLAQPQIRQVLIGITLEDKVLMQELLQAWLAHRNSRDTALENVAAVAAQQETSTLALQTHLFRALENKPKARRRFLHNMADCSRKMEILAEWLLDSPELRQKLSAWVASEKELLHSTLRQAASDRETRNHLIAALLTDDDMAAALWRQSWSWAAKRKDGKKHLQHLLDQERQWWPRIASAVVHHEDLRSAVLRELAKDSQLRMLALATLLDNNSDMGDVARFIQKDGERQVAFARSWLTTASGIETAAMTLGAHPKALSAAVRQLTSSTKAMRVMADTLAEKPKGMKAIMQHWLRRDPGTRREMVVTMLADPDARCICRSVLENETKTDNSNASAASKVTDKRVVVSKEALAAQAQAGLILEKLLPYLSAEVRKKIEENEKNILENISGNNDIWKSIMPHICDVDEKKVFLGKRGIKYVEMGDIPILLKEIFVDEEYYFESARKNPLIIDGGANIGLSIFYFKKLFPHARIIAFEPGRRASRVLRQNVENHGWRDVEIHQVALGSAVGKERFFEPVSMPMGGTLTARMKERHVKGETYQVPVRPLSRWLTEEVDFLKLDIEGMEYDVIEELGDKLRLVRNIFCEAHFGYGGQADFSRLTRMVDCLHNAGFDLRISQSSSQRQEFRPLMQVSRHSSMVIWGKRMD